MKYLIGALVIIGIFVAVNFFKGGSEVRKEFRPLVHAIDLKVKGIDHNHRVQIVEDDYVHEDSVFKIRGYYNHGKLIKLVGITKTKNYERDDYFYFEANEPIFSGHMINFRDTQFAEEFKYYYKQGKVVETLFWEDNYTPGERFPHETFEEFTPDMDSLMKEEKQRVAFFVDKLDSEGMEIKRVNDNLEANSSR
ncbi:MAG: hypothetical protein AAF789_03490 [Bacteroidota bacterium]